jgi:hypothetical protein
MATLNMLEYSTVIIVSFFPLTLFLSADREEDQHMCSSWRTGISPSSDTDIQQL